MGNACVKDNREQGPFADVEVNNRPQNQFEPVKPQNNVNFGANVNVRPTPTPSAAPPLSDYEKLSRAVFDAENQIRTNPKSFIPKLQEKLSRFEGVRYKVPGQVTIVTSEGARAVEEVIAFLQKQAPLPALKLSEGLTKAAKDHANDIGPKGIESHTGSDGSTFGDRLDRHGKWMGKIGENIDFHAADANEVIMDLIIDDGNLNRGHRNNVFSPNFVFVGIAAAKHIQREICVVFDYAQEYTEKGANNNVNANTNTTPTTYSYSGNNNNTGSNPTNSYTPGSYTSHSYTPNSYTPNNYTSNSYTPNSYTPNNYTNTTNSYNARPNSQSTTPYTQSTTTPYGQSNSQTTQQPRQQGTVDYSKLAKEVFDAENKIRTNPKSFIPKLREKLQYFEGVRYKVPGQITIVTNEGARAVEEVITFLEQQAPLPALQNKDGLAKAAKDHANDIGPKGIESHSGSDGSTFGDRISRYGQWNGKIGENIDFCATTADEVIMDLIIDDGNTGRGHRKNVFNPNYVFVGIGCAKHTVRDICVVFDYAQEYN